MEEIKYKEDSIKLINQNNNDWIYIHKVGKTYYFYILSNTSEHIDFELRNSIEKIKINFEN